MASVYADATGAVIATRLSDGELLDLGDYPGAAASLTFDEETNADVVARLRADLTGWHLIGGTLAYNGQGVTLAPDGDTRTLRQQVQTLATILAQYAQDASSAAESYAGMTAAQRLTVQTALLRRFGEVCVIERRVLLVLARRVLGDT